MIMNDCIGTGSLGLRYHTKAGSARYGLGATSQKENLMALDGYVCAAPSGTIAFCRPAADAVHHAYPSCATVSDAPFRKKL